MKTTLKLKLALAFVLVALITGAVLALVFNRFNNKQFTDFVIENQRAELLNLLSDHYSEKGSWQGAEAFFSAMPRGLAQNRQQGQGRRMRDQENQPGRNTQETSAMQDNTPTIKGRLFGLADTDGTVLIALPGGTPTGMALNADVIKTSDPIIVDNKTVGYLLTVDHFPGYSQAETQFIQKSNRALWLALLGATLIAAIIGFFIARGITRPLEVLTHASQRIANRELDIQVPKLSRDEIGILAETFNHMSARLTESDQLRRQMTADIAHDLRTPLTVIGGYVESMRDGDLPVTPKRLGLIADETNRLSKMVDDLRLLSIADAGELNLQKQITEPNELLSHCAKLFEIQAARKNITILLEPSDSPSKVWVDEDRMLQVLSNLLSNAIDYSPEGSQIVLSAKDLGPSVLLEVKDSGPGISSDELPYVFERFHRVDRARQLNTQHSGLGLAIAKAIVTAHGGDIKALSSQGQGTTLQMSLPKHQE